jgi:hypothetical protein
MGVNRHERLAHRELNGLPAATVSCVNYGENFAFLGFHIVREDLRAAAAPRSS